MVNDECRILKKKKNKTFIGSQYDASFVESKSLAYVCDILFCVGSEFLVFFGCMLVIKRNDLEFPFSYYFFMCSARQTWSRSSATATALLIRLGPLRYVACHCASMVAGRVGCGDCYETPDACRDLCRLDRRRGRMRSCAGGSRGARGA